MLHVVGGIPPVQVGHQNIYPNRSPWYLPAGTCTSPVRGRNAMNDYDGLRHTPLKR
jgi:hypothetical protein